MKMYNSYNFEGERGSGQEEGRSGQAFSELKRKALVYFSEEYLAFKLAVKT